MLATAANVSSEVGKHLCLNWYLDLWTITLVQCLNSGWHWLKPCTFRSVCLWMRSLTFSRPYQNTVVAPQVSSKQWIFSNILSPRVNVHARRRITYFLLRSSVRSAHHGPPQSAGYWLMASAKEHRGEEMIEITHTFSVLLISSLEILGACFLKRD